MLNTKKRTLQPVFYLGNNLFVPSKDNGFWISVDGYKKTSGELRNLGAALHHQMLAPQGGKVVDWISKVTL